MEKKSSSRNVIFNKFDYSVDILANMKYIGYVIKNLIKFSEMVSNSNKNVLDYRNKLILAPMVRVGTLPMRLLALEYGADIVYTEELIDWKMLKTTRRENDVLGTIDFVDLSDGTIVFRTCAKEKDKVVLQIGTSDPERALRVGRMVENDVAAVDVNMGCPKEFSLKGGMGAALLTNTGKANSILTTLVNGLSIPVTCKIRIFSDEDRTVNLVKQFETTGISAIAVHGRTKVERPRHAVHTDIIYKVAHSINIPVIANGGSREMEKHSDIYRFKEQCGATSVMIARAAQWNCSIFRKEGLLPLDEVIETYLKLCIDYDNTPSNTKYTVQMMLRELQETPRGKLFLESQTLEDICDIWNLAEYCRSKQLEFQEKGIQGRRELVPGSIVTNGQSDEPNAKKIKLDDDVIEYNIAFFRAHYTTEDLPKTILHLYAAKHSLQLPTYETQQEDRLFRTILTFNKHKYASSYWEKNKRFAEQGAALVCILHLNLIDKNILIKNGSILE